jgi:hypothetical protein
MVLAAVSALVGEYYWWAVRASGDRLFWNQNLNGYYNLLGRGFVAGHLYLPIEPSPQLLSQPNPWDPSVDPALKMHDMALYHGRYYLYFGATPAVLLFAPWRLLTGHDLPERFAIFILAFGGFLCACGALLRVLDLASVRAGPVVLAILLVGLGCCQSIPYLLNRVAIYEVAIAGGYFCLSAALFCLTHGIGNGGRVGWLAGAGLMYGCAVGCRPHLVFAGFLTLAGLILFMARSRGLAAAVFCRESAAFLAAFTLAGLTLAAYNYDRFGNPLEFGLRYQLPAAPGQNRIDLAIRNLLPGFYYMLLSPPYIAPVFPWIRMVWHFIFDSPQSHPFPPQYFIEPTVGALWLSPLILAAPFAPFQARVGREASLILAIVSLSSGAVLLFLMSAHLASHRYETDFVASGVFAAVAGLGIRVCRSSGWRRATLGVALALVVGYSTVANLALGFTGPYDDILKNRPKSYVRIARWFSPAWEFRPKIDPEVAVDLSVGFPLQAPGYREPLISIGHSHYAYSLLVDYSATALSFISAADDSEMTYDLPFPGEKPLTVRLAYPAGGHLLTIDIDGRRAFAQPVEMLIAAPAEIKVGDNPSNLGRVARRFAGRIQILRRDFR